MKHIRSRIHQHIDSKLMKALKDICLDVKISDNNTKVRLIRETLNDHKLNYHELGPGTNRYAILIDGYVFKIAMDKWGVLDNDNEFSMTEVLQPFVTTVYETNGLISVSEYVTLISKEEFTEKKNEIIKILSVLSEGFLLGDVGYAPKNFANWGYRTDDSLVILDFAYIYNIVGDEIMCQKDGNILQYDENFNFMRCPYCRKKYDTIAIRRLIPTEHEKAEIDFSKKAAYALKTDFIEIDEVVEEEIKDNKEEEEVIMDKEYSKKEREESFMNIFNVFGSDTNYKVNKTEERELEPEETPVDILTQVSNMVSNSPPTKPEVVEEEVDPPNTDMISSVINAFSSVKKPVEEEPEEEEEVIDEEDGPRLTPLELMAIAAGADIEDFNNNESVVEEGAEGHDFTKDDGIEENPEDYQNPGQITYGLERAEAIEREEELARHAQKLVENKPEEPIEEVPSDGEKTDMDDLQENIEPVIQITNVEAIEVLDKDDYANIADNVVYPDDEEDEENNPPVEEVKTTGIKRIGDTVRMSTGIPVENLTDTEIPLASKIAIEETIPHHLKNIEKAIMASTGIPAEHLTEAGPDSKTAIDVKNETNKEPEPPNPDDDLMSMVTKVQEEKKYEDLAAKHLGRDPYDY